MRDQSSGRTRATPRRRRAARAFALCLLTAACGEEPESPTETEVDLSPALVQADPQVQAFFPAEVVLLDIMRDEPTFAGIFMEGRTLVINTTDPARAADVRIAAQGKLPTDRLSRADRIESRVVKYSFHELSNWRNSAYVEILQLKDANRLSLSARNNEIVVGFRDGSEINDAATIAHRLGIPEDAIRFEISGPIFPSVLVESEDASVPMPWDHDELDDRERPVPGGVRTRNRQPPGGARNCTIGFNARTWPAGDRVFFTNSHCTEALFDVDNGTTIAVQVSLDADSIAKESLDADDFDCTSWPWESPDICRYSDAAAFEYNPSIDVDSIDFGKIARTTGNPGTGSNAGSTAIDHTNSRFTISSVENGWLIEGDSVHKMGRVGGWTHGEITDDCAPFDVAAANGHPEYRMLCTYRADYRGDPGDSGGPVFEWSGTGSSVKLVGIHFGNDTTYTSTAGQGAFSLYKYVRSEVVGGQLQVYNAGLSGSLQGPDETDGFETCTWYATDFTGGVWPYTYEWSGKLTGSSSTVTGQITSSGWLYLTVEDDVGNQVNDQLYITVDEWGPAGCLY